MIYNDFFRFIENKDRLIDRLDFTDEQKDKLKSFFQTHPNYESKIDWNRKDLTWADFEPLLKLEGKSKSQAKKKGIEGLTEGVDYYLLAQNDLYSIYYPLNHKASQTIASTKVYPYVEGKWCISMNTPDWWNSYVSKLIDFFFICTDKTKYALARYNNSDNCIEIFSAEDAYLTKLQFMRQQIAENDPDKWGNENYIDIEEVVALKEWDPKDWYTTLNGGYYSTTKPRALKKIDMSVKELRVADGCAEISSGACRGSAVEKVYIPNSVAVIGKNVFRDCENLSEVQLPGNLVKLPENMFAGCTNLKKIQLPKDLDVLETGCLEKSGLTEFIAPEGLRFIQTGVFNSCKQLKKVQLNEGLQAIDVYAFNYSGIEEITFPSTLVSLSGSIFKRCSNLKKADLSKLSADKINKLPSELFQQCEALEEVIFPKGLEYIAYKAFMDTGLKEVYIPQNVSMISENAFEYCKNLKTVYLEHGTKFRATTFWNCPNLKDIFYGGTKQQWEYCHQISNPIASGRRNDFYAHTVAVHCSDGILMDGHIDYCQIPYEEYQKKQNVIY